MTVSQAETLPPPICWVDTETTRADHRRVPWEVGLIRRAPDGTDTTHHWWLPPGSLDAADGFALRVGGFWDRHPLGRAATGDWDRKKEGGPYAAAVTPHEQLAQEIVALTHDAVWVGTNPSFDAEPIADILRQQRLLPTWRYDLVDVIVLACGWLHGRADAGLCERPPVKRRSDDIARLLGVEVPESERHTALGDARRDQRIYDIVTGRVPAPAVAE